VNPRPYLTFTAAVWLPFFQALAGATVFSAAAGLLALAVAPTDLISLYLELGAALGLVVTWLYSIELWRAQIKPPVPAPLPVRTMDLSVTYTDPESVSYPFGIILRELHCAPDDLQAMAEELEDGDPSLSGTRFNPLIGRTQFGAVRERMCKREVGLGKWNNEHHHQQSASLTQRGKVTFHAIYAYSSRARVRARKG
jgi:hypothetical protein